MSCDQIQVDEEIPAPVPGDQLGSFRIMGEERHDILKNADLSSLGQEMS